MSDQDIRDLANAWIETEKRNFAPLSGATLARAYLALEARCAEPRKLIADLAAENAKLERLLAQWHKKCEWYCDRGPHGEEYESDELQTLKQETRAALGKVAE